MNRSPTNIGNELEGDGVLRLSQDVQDMVWSLALHVDPVNLNHLGGKGCDADIDGDRNVWISTGNFLLNGTIHAQ